MSRLFKLKKWLTLDDAAKHLTAMLGEEVSVADVYHLALDNHLKLSVNFVNHAHVFMGKVVGMDEVELYIPGDGYATLFDKSQFPEEPILKSRPWGDNLFVNLDNKLESIDGVWDLAMKGAERLDVEHQYQMLVDGPAVTLTNLGGVFVQRGNIVCNLMESFEKNEYHSGSSAAKERLELYIHKKELPDDEAENLREKFKQDREHYIANRDSGPIEDNYYPAGGLPDDSLLVVRTSAILEFLDSINDSPSNLDKPLSTKERNSMLTLIAALCQEAKIDINQRGVAGALGHSIETAGHSLSEDTVRNILKQVKDQFS